jgi:hypothetical protein
MNSSEYIGTLEEKVSQLEKLLYASDAHDGSARQHKESPSHMQTSYSADKGVMESVVCNEENVHETRNFRASFGGFSILDRLHKLCQNIALREGKGSHDDTDEDNFSAGFDLAPPEIKPSISWDIYSSLPSREKIDQAIHDVTTTSCSTLQFLDKPALRRVADEVLEAAETGGDEPSHQSMCLVFAVLALARLCEASSPTATSPEKNGAVNRCPRCVLVDHVGGEKHADSSQASDTSVPAVPFLILPIATTPLHSKRLCVWLSTHRAVR